MSRVDPSSRDRASSALSSTVTTRRSYCQLTIFVVKGSDGTDIVNGGSIGNFGGTVTLINSTLAFNMAYGTAGGGIESSSSGLTEYPSRPQYGSRYLISIEGLRRGRHLPRQ